MKNGRDDRWEDPKIKSISAARKKAEQVRKSSSTGGGVRQPARGFGELLLGAVLVVMAVGLIVSLTRPWWQAALSVSN